MVSSATALLAAVLAFSFASAHMQMVWPYPYKSKFNPATLEANIDYSMTQPLGAYPCKGYIDSSAPSVVSWAAGSTVNYTLAGTAVHGGGSCQLAMSYDLGATWNVIQSIIGGCVIESLTETITIPTEAPSGKALFAWNWFNLQGNREMYQNCAPVDITNGGSGLDSASFPAPFVANVDAAPGCATIENIAVVFPNPGKNVRYGGSYAGTTPKAGAGITGTCGTVNTSPASSAAPASSPSTTSSAPVAGETLFTPAPSSVAVVASASSAAPSSAAHADSISSAAAEASASMGKKCKRSSAKKQHERRARGSHERLVRRRRLNPIDSFVE